MRTRFRFLPCLALLFVIAGSPAVGSPLTPTYVLEFGGAGFQIGQTNFVNGMTTDSLGILYVTNPGTNRIQRFDALGNYLGQFGSSGTGNGQFLSVYGIVGDGAGNFYVSEHTGARIQKLTSTGAYITKWGTAGSGPGQFNGARGIAIDGDGNLYVADSGNHRIQKFTGTGTFVTQWGSYGTGNSQFDQPGGVVVDRDGFVYVSDVANHRIQKFTSSGAYVMQWGTYGPGEEELNNPNGLALDAVGNLYVTDAANDRVHKFTPDGVRITTWGGFGTGPGQFWVPGAITVDAEANVYVMDANNHRIQKFSGAGATVDRWPATYLKDLFGPNGATFNDPIALAAGPGDAMYVVDASSIAKVNSTNSNVVVWGSFGTGNGQFNFPGGVGSDRQGNVYVADTGNHRMQKLSSTGAYVTQWGSFGNAIGQFSTPIGVATDPAGDVYVVDAGNHRVQKFFPTGQYLANWGTAGTGNGQFTNPNGIAVDRTGVVYVADAGNGRIQKFTGDGIYLGQWGSTGSGPGQFQGLRSIAVDSLGNVYALDGILNRVQQFTTTGLLLNSFAVPSNSGASGLGVDAAGSIYVAFNITNRVQKYVAPPAITFIRDVAGDEGRRVKVRIRRSSGDAPLSGATILGYDVYLRSEPLAGAARPDGAATTYLVPATGAEEYEVTVATLADATPAGLEHDGFFVRAWTGTHSHHESGLESGMSVDNLAPPAPSPFVADYGAGTTRLHWTESPAADFTTFRLHRNIDPAFVPGPTTLLVESPDTGYVDPVQPGFTYKLSAVDDAGNESPFATLGPSGTVDVPSPSPVLAFGLDPLWPNPATRRALTVRFTLPRPAPAQLELVDVTGRRVTAREVGGLGAGTHAIDLAAGRPSLGSGVYFVRLIQGGDVAVRRIVLLD
jgi:sugar lactone lactonase YvrE